MQLRTTPVLSGSQPPYASRRTNQAGHRIPFGQQQATCSHHAHTHHAGCSHSHHGHEKSTTHKEASQTIFQKVGQWVTRFYRSLLDDLGALFRFVKAAFGFKQPDSTTATAHTHSEHCHHHH